MIDSFKKMERKKFIKLYTLFFRISFREMLKQIFIKNNIKLYFSSIILLQPYTSIKRSYFTDKHP